MVIFLENTKNKYTAKKKAKNFSEFGSRFLSKSYNLAMLNIHINITQYERQVLS